MSDRTLVCRDCGQSFIFTAGEQGFYAERGYTDPQRCPSCRAARKAERGGGGGYGGGSRGYGSEGGYGGTRTMYATVCSNCGKDTEVPFEPTTGKPVYCRECFQDRRNSYSRY